ncbi:MAG: metallophosphoesterase [Acidobacteria bacterium]|nr:metallophosphoesterase [Acidobacteriota bacterium]
MGRRFAEHRFLCLLCLLGFLWLQATLAEQPPASSVRFAVIGDSGTGSKHQYRVAEQMVAWHDRLPYGLVLMLGDNIYGLWWRGGRKEGFERKFDRPYGELLRRGVFFRAALGNHDMRHRDGQDLIGAYDRFHIDGPRGYYHFTAGQAADGNPLVEFFVLNSIRLEHDKQDPGQLAWLEQALAGSRARWRIAYFHHPLYSTGAHHGPDPQLRAKLEPLFLGVLEGLASSGHGLSRAEGTGTKLGALAPEAEFNPAAPAAGPSPRVHVVLSGHDHIYQRFHPQQGVLYFIVGFSGQLRRGNARPSPEVAAVNDQTRGFLLMEATPDQLRFFAIDDTGRAFDCGQLDRSGEVAAEPCPSPPEARLDRQPNLE